MFIRFNSFYFFFPIIIFLLSLFYNLTSPITFKQNNLDYHYNSNFIFDWPFEENFQISSSFGKRIHPVSKKVSYHSGIDIPAKENTNIYSISDGTVSFTNFSGANGYTIKVIYNNFEILYGHVSPNFLLKEKDLVQKNQLIATVGPKYLSIKTPYPANNGYYLNGLTTGTHLHLEIKKDGIAVNPLDYL